jgi:hypothetical protein
MRPKTIAAAAAVALSCMGAGAAASNCNNPVVIAVPPSFAADCSTDVTAKLDSLLTSVPIGATVQLGAKACYLVSQDPTNLLTVNGTSGVTIDGNGARLRQTTYVGGNALQPVLTLTANTNLTVNNLAIVGPSAGGGSHNEGDYGVRVGGTQIGNTGVTLNAVTIANVEGDALTVVPDLGTCCGLNQNVTLENSTVVNAGYHTIVPEGVENLTVDHNTFIGDPDFMDMEVDTNYPPDGGYPGTGTAQWNITVSNNTFTSGSVLGVFSNQGTCIPQQNIAVTNNTVTATGRGVQIELSGSGNASCGRRDNGFTMTGNTSSAPGNSPCGGSVAAPPAGCSMIEVQDYNGVDIENNSLLANDGQVGYFPNTLFVPCIGLTGDQAVTIKDNSCNNAWDLWQAGYVQFTENDFPMGTVTACSNAWGLTEPVGGAPPAPQSDPNCTTLLSGGRGPCLRSTSWAGSFTDRDTDCGRHQGRWSAQR